MTHVIGDHETIRILTIQWNVGNARPNGFHDLIPKNGDGFDLIVLGLQESTYYVPSAVVREESMEGDRESKKSMKDRFSPCYQDILDQIGEVIGKEFTLIRSTARMQMQLVIYSRKHLRPIIRNVRISKENTGYLHVFPNKGGICVTLDVGHTKFAFVSCHLNAHEGVHYCSQRNSSIEEILNGVRCGDKRFDPTLTSHHTIFMGDLNYRITFDPTVPESTVNRISFRAHQSTSDATAADSDGDLAKLYSTLSREEQVGMVLEMIDTERWDDLLQFDELSREMRSGRALDGFTSLTPNFPPTFKRERGRGIKRYCRTSKALDSQERPLDGATILAQPTSVLSKDEQTEVAPSDVTTTYDRAEDSEDEESEGLLSSSSIRTSTDADIIGNYSLNRLPSYTDRILYKSLPGFSSADHIQVLFFESCESVTTSDHKPVRACFEVRLCKGATGIMLPVRSHSRLLPVGALKRFKSSSRTGSALSLKALSSKFSSRRIDSHGSKGDRDIPNAILVEIFNLEGHDLAVKNLEVLGMGGLSDPFILVTADPEGVIGSLNESGEVKSSIKYATVNPAWTNEIISFELRTIDIHGLSENVHLFISVWDHNTANNHLLIGVMPLAMRDILETFIQGKYNFDFNGFVYSSALKQGELKGSITLTPIISTPQGIRKESQEIFRTLYEEEPVNLRLHPQYNLSSSMVEGGENEAAKCGCNLS